MSVCASANPFSSRKVSPPSRRPLADNERWAALNKNIFQDILNAILFQTTFSPSYTTGKRHNNRPEVSLRSVSSPQSVSEIEGGTVTPIVDCKENVCLESFDSCLDPEIPCVELTSKKRETTNKDWIPRRTSTDEATMRTTTTPAEKAASFDADKSRMTSKRSTEQGSAGISEALCTLRRSEIPQDKAVGFLRSCEEVEPSFSVPSRLKGSPLSVYCETLLANVPMMIIGLRPYGSGHEDHLNRLHIHPADSTGTIPVMLPTKDQMENPPALKSSSDLSNEKDHCILTDILSRDSDGSNSVTKILNKFDHFRSPAPIKQLQSTPPNNYSDRQIKTSSSSSSPYHHLQSQLHHTHNHHHHHSDLPSDLTRKPGDRQDHHITARKTGSSSSAPAKSSRDHSILTILGLLSTDDDDRRKSRDSSSSSSSSSSSPVSTSSGDRKRLLGIGVTVAGASRWMAVDKDIVYDMIDQVLNGDRDCFMGTTADPSRPSKFPADHHHHHHHPKSGDRKPGVRRAGFTGSRCQGFALLAHRNGRKEMPPPPSGVESTSKQRHPRGHPDTRRIGPLQAPSQRPSPKHDQPIAKQQRQHSPDGLEGVSVLRSLLNDDDDEPTEPDISLSTSASSFSQQVRDSTPEFLASSERLPVKRSRQSVTESKKRRTTEAPLDPSSSDSCPLSSSSSSTSSSASGASSRPDPSSSPLASCRSSLSMKWKSSMLMRMRTEEEEAPESDAAVVVVCQSSSDGTL